MPFNRAPLRKHFPDHGREEPKRTAPTRESQVEAVEHYAERMAVPRAPGLRVIARSGYSIFDARLDNLSTQSFALVPLIMMKLTEVCDSRVGNSGTSGMNDDHLNVTRQFINDAQSNQQLCL